MGGLRKFSSLEDRASAQVAINLCQENGFKEVALCLEKPTYGGFIAYDRSQFVSDTQKLLIWTKMKKDKWSLEAFAKSCDLSNVEKVRRWDAAVDEQCQRLTEGIGFSLRQGIHAWINRIALEYLSYSRRQEVLFGVSRYFLMDIFTRGDWREAARLDEKQLTQRLLEDERLTVLQRYRIACVYCLHVHIHRLWERLTQKEKRLTSGCGKLETHRLVLFWSRHMGGDREENVIKDPPWYYAVHPAASYGNRTAVMLCWNELKDQQQIVIDMAFESLRHWQLMEKKSYAHGSYKDRLVSNYSPMEQSAWYVKDFNLPSYYNELTHFFLSQMDKEQQLSFFRKALQIRNCDSVLECFLDWPYQDDFLPMIEWLEGMEIIPRNKYGQCLLALASKYSGNDEKENSYYDYRSLLKILWGKTPEKYKQYVFCNEKANYLGRALLSCVLNKSPFQQGDETLFKQIFCDQPQEERREMMRSEVGKDMCSTLTQKEKWSFMNWLLQECLSQKEITVFKKEFIQSKCGRKLCLDALVENRERLVEELIDWSLELETEKTQFKDLIGRKNCLRACKKFLHRGEFAKIERLISFCVSTDEDKERFKADCARHVCRDLLNNCAWEQMDTILAWSFGVEEKIGNFKKNLFFFESVFAHYNLVFLKERWEEVERFYQWFGLSPEEIKELKRDTLFSFKVVQHLHKSLPDYANVLLTSLRWCLTGEEMVNDFKKRVESVCFTGVLDERKKKKERLDDLINELLDGFRKDEIQDKTRREDAFVKDKGERRAFTVIEDESCSPRKRCK